MPSVGHMAHGLWVHPEDQRYRFNDLDFWLEEARLLEEGLFDSVFFADSPAIKDDFADGIGISLREAMQAPLNDPLLIIAAMATVTEHLGFISTSSTTYEHPFSFARRASTLDHLTKGRFGWNIVTSQSNSAAKNYGLNGQIEHDERYRIADEYMEVVYKLWEGDWADDAVRLDRVNRVYADPARVRYTDHHGKHFQVRGPHVSTPSIQRTPALFQAGSSSTGQAFGAKHAEGMFVAGKTLDQYRSAVQHIRRLVVENGRRPDHVKVYASAVVIVDATTERAQAKADLYRTLASEDAYTAHFSSQIGIDISSLPRDADYRKALEKYGPPGLAEAQTSGAFATTLRTVQDAIDNSKRFDQTPFFVVGTATEVADKIEQWVDYTGLDGFNLRQFITPETIRDFVEYVVPELQKRGRYRSSYETSTLREHMFGAGHQRLFDEHPASAYRQRPVISQ